jgi:WD40 repeat protein
VIWSAAFDADGEVLTTRSLDGSVRRWDVQSGFELRVLSGREPPESGGEAGGDARPLPDVAHEIIAQFGKAAGAAPDAGEHPFIPALGLAFSADGDLLASSHADGWISLWDPLGGARRLSLRPGSPTAALAFGPHGGVLASGADTGSLLVWDAAGNLLKRLTEPGAPILGMAFLDGIVPHLRWVRAGGSIQVFEHITHWDRGATRRHDIEMEVSGATPTSAAISQSSLAVGFSDGTVVLHETPFDEVSLKPSAALRLPPGERSGAVRCLAFSPGGGLLAAGSDDGWVRFWGLDWHARRGAWSMRALRLHAQAVRAMAFSPSGTTLAIASNDNTVRVWHRISGSLRVLAGHTAAVTGVAFSPSHPILASCSMDGTVRLWGAATGDLLAMLIPLEKRWAALTPDGRFHMDGSAGGAFWHLVGLCRFAPGELDAYIASPMRLPDGAPILHVERYPPSGSETE